MSDRDDHWRTGMPERRSGRRLGRLSVFILGLFLGFVIGALSGVAAWQAFAPDASVALDAAFSPAHAAQAKPAPAVAAPPPAPQPLRAITNRPVRIGVFGDSLGDGLWAGLYRDLHGEKRFVVDRFSQASTGLTRYDYVDVGARTTDQLAGKSLDAAVVLFGANDEQAISMAGVIHPFGSEGWRRIYAARMAALVATLRQHGAVAVYWVGLPKMKRPEYDARASVLNGVYAAEARALGATYVPTVAATVDGAGAFQDYLPATAGGRPVLMRARDGIHMTMQGYLRIAAPVAAQILSDAGPAAPAPAS